MVMDLPRAIAAGCECAWRVRASAGVCAWGQSALPSLRQIHIRPEVPTSLSENDEIIFRGTFLFPPRHWELFF